MADERSDLERRLSLLSHIFSYPNIKPTAEESLELTCVLREAADEIARLRRAVELSRIWWDDSDVYRDRWNHRGPNSPCNHDPCAACRARAAAMEALGLTGGDHA